MPGSKPAATQPPPNEQIKQANQAANLRKRLTFVKKERTPSPDSDDAKKKPAIVTGGIKKKINTANLFGGNESSSSSDSDKKKKPSPTRQP